jgi:hypothetical protein
MSLHIDSMPDDPTIQAMMYGPLVLAGRFESGTGFLKEAFKEVAQSIRERFPACIQYECCLSLML